MPFLPSPWSSHKSPLRNADLSLQEISKPVPRQNKVMVFYHQDKKQPGERLEMILTDSLDCTRISIDLFSIFKHSTWSYSFLNIPLFSSSNCSLNLLERDFQEQRDTIQFRWDKISLLSGSSAREEFLPLPDEPFHVPGVRAWPKLEALCY